MASTLTATAPRGWFVEKILLGMEPRTYLRSLLTPWNVVIAGILAVGVPLIFYRFYAGLGAVTNLSQIQPWGLWIGFDMMTGIVLAAGGFTLGAAVHLFGMHQYHPIVRPALLTAFLGYLLAVFGLIADLGKPWNMIMAIRYHGSASALFEVAWCVMLYTTVLTLEFLVPFFEWIGWRKAHDRLMKAMLALTVLSVVFSTMHQSALGSLFLIAPAKLHPLWYSPYIFIFFFISAVAAGISMVVFEGTLSHRAFRHRITGHHADMDKLQLGLGKAGAIVLFAYFFLKLQGVAEGHHWELLFTGWGAWFLLEIVGFVLVPAFLYGYGARHGKVRFVRAASVMAVLGIILNRLNVSVIAYNWNAPVRYVPSWMEITVSVTLITLGVVAFRWIVNRMPIMSEDPRFAGSEF
ncbi:MAG TPA: Ni/Fe-hydrogenase cytochrome b subunit [Anaeromyxobacteraceae bacterium]|nr:Ni/Fe-hydrogenase cytochrome b subunit [Anaeromyxobacteraceae bacterium]